MIFTDNLIKCNFSRMRFLEIQSYVTGSIAQKHQHLVKTILAPLDNVENLDIRILDNKIVNLCKIIHRFWNIVSGTKQEFMHENCDQFNKTECIELEIQMSTVHSRKRKPDQIVVRTPRQRFCLSWCSKHRRLVKLSQAMNTLLNTSDNSIVNLQTEY